MTLECQMKRESLFYNPSEHVTIKNNKICILDTTIFDTKKIYFSPYTSQNSRTDTFIFILVNEL